MNNAPLEKISTLIESVIHETYQDNVSAQDKIDYTRNTLRNILDIIKNLSAKKYYVRICKDRQLDELDIENLQLYSEDDIREEYFAIDYIDEDEVNNLSIEDLQEIAMNNDEYLEEISVIQNL